METNPFLSKPIERKIGRYAMLSQNILGFISSDGTNNPFSTKSKALFLCGKQAKTTKFFWEITKIIGNYVKEKMIGTRSTVKIPEKSFQYFGKRLWREPNKKNNRHEQP